MSGDDAPLTPSEGQLFSGSCACATVLSLCSAFPAFVVRLLSSPLSSRRSVPRAFVRTTRLGGEEKSDGSPQPRTNEQLTGEAGTAAHAERIWTIRDALARAASSCGVRRACVALHRRPPPAAFVVGLTDRLIRWLGRVGLIETGPPSLHPPATGSDRRRRRSSIARAKSSTCDRPRLIDVRLLSLCARHGTGPVLFLIDPTVRSPQNLPQLLASRTARPFRAAVPPSPSDFPARSSRSAYPPQSVHPSILSLTRVL